jgi:hypothetical protein
MLLSGDFASYRCPACAKWSQVSRRHIRWFIGVPLALTIMALWWNPWWGFWVDVDWVNQWPTVVSAYVLGLCGVVALGVFLLARFATFHRFPDESDEVN